MEKVVIIDARAYAEYAHKPWGIYPNTLEAVKSKAFPLVDRIILMGAGHEIALSNSATAQEVFLAIMSSVKEEDIILYLYADEPFIDCTLLAQMLAKHQRYHANYSFGEGFPKGITAQIISGSILSKLGILGEGQSTVARDYIFEVMKKEINFFDIETELSPVDLRDRRLLLNYESYNNSLISDQLLTAGATNWATLLPLITEKPELLWARPVYYNLQISSDCPQRCTYCPYPTNPMFNTKKMMKLAPFKQLLESIHAFSREAVIGFNLAGEAALHPQLPEFIAAVASYPTLRLHIETSGLGWTDEAWQGFVAFPAQRSSLIISLDSLVEAEYTAMRGEGFNEVVQFTKKATELEITKGRTWLQCVRLKQNESTLEQFYRAAKKMTDNVIIQKYDDFAQALPALKAINIAPLVRRGCWVLQREMSITLDGEVYACKEDLAKEHLMGNVFKQPLSEVWATMNGLRLAHATCNYPALCQKCDEFYVYNF